MIQRVNRLILKTLLLAGLVLAAQPFRSSASAPVPGEPVTPTPTPAPVLGPALEGFDLTLLRSGKRVEALRYEIKEIRSTTSGAGPRRVSFSLALEFGRESGLAEAAKVEAILRTAIRDLVGGFTTQQLLTVEGKMELKERILGAANKRMSTAQARQIYFTDFQLQSLTI